MSGFAGGVREDHSVAFGVGICVAWERRNRRSRSPAGQASEVHRQETRPYILTVEAPVLPPKFSGTRLPPAQL
jgi:hypothetical protein